MGGDVRKFPGPGLLQKPVQTRDSFGRLSRIIVTENYQDSLYYENTFFITRGDEKGIFRSWLFGEHPGKLVISGQCILLEEFVSKTGIFWTRLGYGLPG